MAVVLPSRWPMVGRIEVWRQLRAALNGRARVVLIHGEPGVGKTRLAGEAFAQHRQDGRAGLHVTATAAGAQIPLSVLAPLLTAGDPDIDELTREPVRLLGHLRRAVQALPGNRPALLVVDDLPQLDTLSALLLSQLVEGGVVTLLATARSGMPLPDAQVGLWSGDGFLRIDLEPFGPHETTAALAKALDAPVAARTSARLHQVSGGLPLHLRELVFTAVGKGSLAPVDGVWRLNDELPSSPALRDLLLLRLHGLDDEHQLLLRRLALCQPLAIEEFPPGSEPGLGALEERGLVDVTIDDETGSVVELAHPGYAVVLRADIPRMMARRVLREQITIVEGRSRGQADAVRLAIWRLQADGSADADLLLRAARLARYHHDYPSVRRLTSAAVRRGPPDPETLLLLGEASAEVGEVGEAEKALDRAALLAPSGPIGGRLAVVRANLIGYHRRQPEAALALLREARAGLPDQYEQLTVAIALHLGSEERTAEALHEIDQLGPAASETAEDLSAYLMAAGPALVAAGRSAEATRLGEQTVRRLEDNRAQGGLIHLSGPLMVLAAALTEEGRLEEALAVAQDALRAAIDDGHERLICSAEWRVARVLFLTGRARSCARWCQDVVSGARAAGFGKQLALGLSSLSLALAVLGDVEGARRWTGPRPAALRKEEEELYVVQVFAEAWTCAARGDVRAGQELLLAVAHRGEQRGQLAAASTALLDVARLGAPEEAARRLRRLAPACDSRMVDLRAQFATAAADADPAALESVGQRLQETGSWLLAAEAFAWGSTAWRRAGHPRRASALATRSGELRGRCEGAVTPALLAATGYEPLTPREREIAMLAASGLASREIAERLVLSVRTVNNHLQAVYGKLGVAGRRDLKDALIAA